MLLADDDDGEEQLRHQLVETVEVDDFGQWPVNGNGTLGGHREVESGSSDYEPSATSSSPEPGQQKEEGKDGQSVGSGDDNEDEIDDGNESSSYEEDENLANLLKSSRKRSYQLSNASADPETLPPRGRRKRARKSLNMPYMAVLHDDMDDARRQYIPSGQTWHEATQVGLTVWTSEEKELFYEAVSRLGRDDIPGIAGRLLGSKSELEVHQFLHFLQTDTGRRRFEARAPLHRPLLSDFPAATEISEACCAALEKTADVVARREDNQYSRDEYLKWGHHWLVKGDNCRDLSKAALEVAGMPNDDEASYQSPAPDGGFRGERIAEIGAQLRPDAVPPLALFHVKNMLLLSERVFMNGIDEDAHYMGLGDALPSAHLSALHDLYELVYALTQRVAATAMHICQFRYQSDHRLARKTKRLVRRRDVHAAVASLGLKKDAQAFWARCPRRLGLNVSRSAVAFADVDGASRLEVASEPAKKDGLSEDEESYREEDESSGEDEDEDDDIMTYDEVEKQLLPENNGSLVDLANTTEAMIEDIDSSSSYDVSDETSSDSGDNANNRNAATTLMEKRINEEANEIIRYSATGYPNASWARTSLKNRIRDELKEEEYACAVDDLASRRDELYLWAVLGQEPPSTLNASSLGENATPHVEGFSVEARRYPVDEVVQTGSNWRAKLQYEAEWEATAAEEQEKVRADKEEEEVQ
ncbi:hypothetical protein SEUCBS140593_003537 [Sporothrix eucalyptigena]|uniref:Myb-like domain-containing protein n=1 Tax=Sporothrix eucalyptigena TaxID=1812306 RepID=A0ABP0BFK3_9PEZI